MRKIILRIFDVFICYPFTNFIVEVVYGGFWRFRKHVKKGSILNLFYKRYMNRNHFFIGLNASFETEPILPHGMNGIHISSLSKIGRNVTIFQQVTIGSNTLKGHIRYGAPIIGNNVYIGAGAKIIGKVKIGNNCRIGANAVVVKDMESNTTAIQSPTRYIKSDNELDNSFYPILS